MFFCSQLLQAFQSFHLSPRYQVYDSTVHINSLGDISGSARHVLYAFVYSVIKECSILLSTVSPLPILKRNRKYPCKYINTQPILLLYLCCSLTLICINAFSISIIHAGYNMHILLLPVHHRKDKNLLPAPALDLTVFCIFPGLYLM